MTEVRPITLEHRLEMSWKGQEFHPGYSFDARIRIPCSELREFETPNDAGGKIMRFNPPPPVGHAIEVAVMSGPAHHVGLCPTRDGPFPFSMNASLHSVDVFGSWRRMSHRRRLGSWTNFASTSRLIHSSKREPPNSLHLRPPRG